MRAATRRAAAVLGALLAGACASGPAVRDAFYRLEAPAPRERLAARKLCGILQVERLRADALTGERSLLYRQGANPVQVRRHAFHLWVDPPTTMLQLELARFLRDAGAASQVVTPEQRSRADFGLSGRILRLERWLSSPPRVVLELDLALTRQAGGDLLHHRVYRAEVRAAGDGVDQAVEAFDQALASLLERLLDDLPSADGDGGAPCTAG